MISGSAAFGQDFPKLSGRVVDEADLLNPAEEAALTAKLEGLETQSQRQLVVATIKDLQGYDIADYGYQLGRKWGLGDKERNDGALLIIAPNARKMRIEVGYGLEATLTDALSSQIIRNDITPHFKAGDLPGGINAGVDSIVTQLQLPPDEAAKVAASASAEQARSNDHGVDASSIIFWLFIFFFFILPMISTAFRDKRHGRTGSGPVVIWGGGSSWGGSSGGSSWGGGGFSGGGGSFGGGGASGGW
ncbi:MAG: TPM domain-containing protein [Sphingorhabdus sp.]